MEPQHAGRRDRPDPAATKMQLLWWYALLLATTLAFKILALKQIYRSGFQVVVRSISGSNHAAVNALYAGLIFLGDFLEVGLLVAAVYLVGHLLLRVRLSFLIVVGTLVLLLFGALNTISCYELSMYTTLGSLQIAFYWILDNPDVLRGWFGWTHLPLVPIAVAWSVVPVLMAHLTTRTRLTAPVHSVGRRMVVPIVLALVLSTFGVRWRDGFTPNLATQGYWSACLSSLLVDQRSNPLLLEPPAREQLLSEYRALIYPNPGGAGSGRLVEIPGSVRRPRHVVMVSLETAPQAYYPIVDNPELPSFERMSGHAIVSEQHYSSSPFTHWSNYAMLSGLYPKMVPSIIKLGDARTDGLGNVLVERGYEATFIDSWLTDWNPGDENRRLIESLGFDELIQFGKAPGEQPVPESRSFVHVREHLLAADARGDKALLFVDTMRGHYPWGHLGEGSASDNLRALLQEFDALFGSFLEFLEEHDLDDEVIVVVTGDHGLRFRKEYEALEEADRHVGLAFNVPFLIHAPGLLDAQVRLPHATSHVDITPTLLYLLGIDDGQLVHHGENVLNRRLAGRVNFMMNTNLSPVDGFQWRGYFFTYNRLTGEAEIASGRQLGAGKPQSEALAQHPEIPAGLHDTRAVLRAAQEMIDLTAAHQLARSQRDHGPTRGQARRPPAR